jgi:DNA-binding NtrC family response regulator
MASILLLGLDEDLAAPLALVLRRLSHEVTITNSLAASLRDRRAHVVFAAGDCPRYREIVQKLTGRRPDAAVILVNRHPEDARWLDALELGAADYCGAPFEATQIQWLVDGALRGLSKPAAA